MEGLNYWDTGVCVCLSVCGVCMYVWCGVGHADSERWRSFQVVLGSKERSPGDCNS